VEEPLFQSDQSLSTFECGVEDRVPAGRAEGAHVAADVDVDGSVGRAFGMPDRDGRAAEVV
jgi:hypothetical protein